MIKLIFFFYQITAIKMGIFSFFLLNITRVWNCPQDNKEKKFCRRQEHPGGVLIGINFSTLKFSDPINSGDNRLLPDGGDKRGG